ncbi:MAG: hypothetical protein JJ953_04455 [Gracilimonas sp.]|uniref:hypothetical protein n=1 Tax=Gracilimonas TaxID=649462 RepID=UPI001B27144C|nr:hypothetical protein [Gracilimonas sp.]MBO6585333.1 hypothetical protein [Gracilimonas sp.]MBO6616329.1 hypothetical protein [Gracilimonas sp.]
MSKKQSKKPEQAGLHEKRLADLLKFLSNNETTIKSEGITYTSKRGDGYNHIKDAIQQVTGMSEKAYYAYFEGMELGNKFSEMRKVYDTVGKVIHTIRPYMTYDGSVDSQKNCLLQSRYDMYNPDKDNDTLHYLNEFYDPFYNSVLKSISMFENNPIKFLSSIQESETPFYSYIQLLIDELKDNVSDETLKSYNTIIKKFILKYNACLSSEIKNGFFSDYKWLSIPTNPEIAKEFFYLKVSSEDHQATDLFINPSRYIDVLANRYEYMWMLYLQKIDFKLWPEIAKGLLPVIAIEQGLMSLYIEIMIFQCIENTRFQITSASDDTRPKHVHTEFTLNQLCKLLAEYQFFDIEQDFISNEFNLLRRPLNIHPVYDVAKLGESEHILSTALLKYMWEIYYRKITYDLYIKENPAYNTPVPRVRTESLINLNSK